MPFERSPEAELPAYEGEELSDLARRRWDDYNQRLNDEVTHYTYLLIEQWPCANPTRPSIRRDWLQNSNNLIGRVTTLFTIWYRNLELRNHLAEAQSVLDRHRASSEGSADFLPYEFTQCSHHLAPHSSEITFDYLFTRGALSGFPPLDIPPPKQYRLRGCSLINLLMTWSLSFSILHPIRFTRDMVKDLLPVQEVLTHYHAQCEADYLRTFRSVQVSLSPSTSDRDQRGMALFTAGLWPSLAIRALLRQLSSAPLTDEWEGVLVSLAATLLRFQQARRLLSYCLLGRRDEFIKEAVNSIEGNFLARSIQIDIAEKMMAPPSGENSILQLNMGEGKSSVIVPMAAASLADGHKLVRVVVLKPLLKSDVSPTRQSTRWPRESPNILCTLFDAAVKIGPKEHISFNPFLVVQPEHLLSFKLMGINRRLSTTTTDSVGDALLRTQKWLERNSRDILDESDEILHVKYQLVYTLGQSQRLEHHPHRWAIVQDVFACVQEHVQEIKVNFPSGIDIQEETWSWLWKLHLASAYSIPMLGYFRTVHNSGSFTGIFVEAATDFITQLHPSPTNVSLLRKSCDENLWKSVLLLRGLLAHGILSYVLRERRWRVDYGLDPSRSLLAVPYRAKDVPAVRAEFGHPDVCIALTALSYYYGGLSESQLDTCFNLLAELDNPDEEYEKWIRNNDRVPDSLRARAGINVQDASQRHDYLQPAFLNNRAVINFFLSSVVFPKEGKEFQHKARYIWMGHRGTEASWLLKLIMSDPDIHVLLDVGAQMLDVSNSALAERWLSSRPRSFAAIYFGDDDNLVVRTRDGNIEPFISSPFSKRLHESEPECLVYLDDAHTRGTDLKLPETYCAAVTLGPKVTKDRLVQGCMRMRLLGHGQSVKFFAPPEVDLAIRQAFGMSDSDRISVSDVLRWAMLESCSEIQHFLPHWREQGIQYASRRQAWLAFFFELSTSRYDELAISGMRSEEVRMEEEQEREVDRTKWNGSGRLRDRQTGIIRPNSDSFITSLSPLAHINRGIQPVWSSKLFSTIDFAITIRASSAVENRDFLRPVNWIVSNLQQDIVILSPFEVNHFLPEIRRSKVTHLHIYAPRTTQSMISFDDFKFHCIPPLPRQWITPPSLVISQLNLWAGQLYLRDHRTYLELCRFLGIDMPEDGCAHRAVQTDGNAQLVQLRGEPDSFHCEDGWTETKGMSYLSSHIGKLVNAALVKEEDFVEFFHHSLRLADSLGLSTQKRALGGSYTSMRRT
ncbi:hypothetical protein BS47DRAFT_1363216 [Hydnum rufescens UP504]|uniref:ubiquitinyl hydrolase 1 n=1 Tax=Hydnum rufescens UP504 TaxID=1448309 RepID=A0A9P6AV49_9AGAM|nr:hypothetical protein BS47DRAFT_1363216 [Hydnum rufescens UP504]